MMQMFSPHRTNGRLPFRRSALAAILVLLLVGCASEDPNLVNPPPDANKVGLRLFNFVPDGSARTMVLELNIATTSVPAGTFSAVVNSPGDSSRINIMRGSTEEYASGTRFRFTRKQIMDVFAMPRPNASTPAFDTIMMQTANAVLITTSNANVRLVNAFPDTTLSFVLRLGCPNGAVFPSSLGDSSVRFSTSSLYGEIPPGLAVFSIIERSISGERTVGIVQFDAAQTTPYSLILHATDPSQRDPSVMLLQESDLTANAQRTVLPVVTRTGYMRVLNTSSSSVSATRISTGQILASNLATRGLSKVSEVPTCESYEADKFEVTFSSGQRDTDSVSLNVRKNYTLIAADSGMSTTTIMVLPAQAPDDAATRSVLRVVHAASKSGKVDVSIGARTDPTSSTNVSSGYTVSHDLDFKNVSAPSSVASGELPITITTAGTPTTILELVRTSIEVGHSYLLVLRDRDGGGIEALLIDDTAEDQVIPTLEQAVLLRFVNGSAADEFETASIGIVVNNAKVYYRNSLSTCVRVGVAPISAGGVTVNTDPVFGMRTLCIYAEGNGAPGISVITTPPLSTVAGQSERRVINATADVAFVSCAYDSIPSQTPGAEKLADKVAYGLWSTPDLITRERRGTFYFYDSNTFAQLFTLPVQFGPLGNSYSLIVTGSKSKGYEVIVLQEF
ncbi:MAG: DUF4397 domain-containing protein [Bacteroidetes bacterium]|nr:DUF4397 domain-containing protein [Bacteroidota bacterium]